MPEPMEELTQNLTKKTRENLLPVAIQELRIDVPIYRIEETKTLIKFFVLGHSAPIAWRKPRSSLVDRVRQKGA